MQSYRIIIDTYLFKHEDTLMDQDPLRKERDIDGLDNINDIIQDEKDKLINDYGDEEYPNPDPDLNDEIDELLDYIEILDRPHSTTYVGKDRVVHLFVSF